MHELLFDGEVAEESDDLHHSELRGRNIRAVDGVWKDFLPTGAEGMGVSAGPVRHTGEASRIVVWTVADYDPVNCLGYILSEAPRPLPLIPSLYVPHLLANASALALLGTKNPQSLLSVLQRTRKPITLPDGTILTPPAMGGPGRKIVILGDTYDANGCKELAMGADLLIHESTNAFLPTLDLSQAPSEKRGAPTISERSVLETARAHGHSVPSIAGKFAKSISAKALILNHISVKYPAPVDPGELGHKEEDPRRDVVTEIARLASEAWGGGEAVVARDFMEVNVPRRREIAT